MWTDQAFSPWWPLLGAVLLAALMGLRRGLRDPLFLVVLYYVFFAFGPVLNWLRGDAVYFGTVQWFIPEAALISALGIAGLYLGGLIMPVKRRFNLTETAMHCRTFVPLRMMLGGLSAYAATMLLVRGPIILGAVKTTKIALLGPLHYPYLLVEFFAIAFYFLARRDSPTYHIYRLNFVLYLGYCLLAGERDFVFAFLSIGAHRLMVGEWRPNARLITASLAVLYGSTYVFNQRFNAGTVTSADILNQGSLLFVNSRIHSWVPSEIPFRHGFTYLNGLANLLPRSVFHTTYNSLDWFKERYAPGGDSGYGFALDGEAYLNFGYVGPLVVFVCIAIIHRSFSNRIDERPFYAYMSVFLTAFLPYSLRNDSFTLMKGTVYAALAFAVVYGLMSSARKDRLPAASDPIESRFSSPPWSVESSS